MTDQLFLFAPADVQPPTDIQDAARYYLHVILCGCYSRKHDYLDGSTRIYSQLMRSILGERVESKVRNWLLDHGVIETDGVYSAGHFSKSYSITPKYRTNIKRFQCGNPNINARIRLSHSKRDDLREVREDLMPVKKHLDEWANRFDFDLEGAIDYLDDPNSIHLMPTDNILSKTVFYTPDDYGRLHTPFTRLFTPLRKFLYYNSLSLYNNDISNSQLVFLLKLYKEYIRSNTIGGNIHPIHHTETTPLCSVTTLGLVYDKSIRVDDLIEEGTFYDYFLEEAKKDAETKIYIRDRRVRQKQKNEWQRRFAQWRTTSNLSAHTKDEWKALKKRFRTIQRVRDIPVQVPKTITRKDFKAILFADVLFGNNHVDTPVTRLVAGQFPEFFAFKPRRLPLLITEPTFKLPQQNLWVNIGSGRSPS